MDLIMAVSGKAGSGKDTTFFMIEEIAEQDGFIVKRFSFADALKDEVYEAVLKPNGYPRSALDTVGQKEQFRTLLQWWGDWRRTQVSPTYWTDKLFSEIEDFFSVSHDESEVRIAMICDCRYYNEAVLVEERGGIVVRINRPVAVLDNTQSLHLSEVELDNYDFKYVINNEGNLDTLRRWVESLLLEILADVS